MCYIYWGEVGGVEGKRLL